MLNQGFKKSTIEYLATLPKKLILLALKAYQHTLSPDHGWGRFLYPRAGCRFYPSCSQYAVESVERYGVVRGLFRATLRLGRCHPWSEGGFNPVT